MKKFLQTEIGWMLTLFFVAGMVACTDDKTEVETAPLSKMEVQLTSVGAASVGIKVTSQNITEIGWLITSEQVSLDPTAIFANGRSKAIDKEVFTTTINGLDPTTHYYLYFAGITTEEEYHHEVQMLECTTESFSDEITVFDISYDSFRVHVNWPEEVQEGNVLKWGLGDYAILKGNEYTTYDQMINLHDGQQNYFSEEKTFTFDNTTENMFSPVGIEYYLPIVPNAKMSLLIGEFAYVAEDEIGYWITDEEGDEIYVDFTDGYHEPGYYTALFDKTAYREALSGQHSLYRLSPLAASTLPDQAEFWTGYFRKVDLQTKAPEKLEASFDIQERLTPAGGYIDIRPSKEIRQYTYGCFTKDAWALMETYLPEVNDEYRQWFMTTMYAFMYFNVGSNAGAASLDIGVEIYPVIPGETYYLALVGTGDDYFHTQCYHMQPFTIPNVKYDAPTVEITAIDRPANTDIPEQPYELWFNVKCTSATEEGRAATKAIYAFNYKREWDQSGYQKEQLVQQGYLFTEQDVYDMNTPEGCNIVFTASPDTEYGLGVMVMNEEGSISKAAYAEAKSSPEQFPERYESPLFEELAGDWTMSEQISYSLYHSDTATYTYHTCTRQSQVTIGEMAMPATLSEEIYRDFATRLEMSKEETNAVYQTVLAQAEAYNATVRGRNRILCQGFDTWPIIAQYGYAQTAYCSPFTLFVNWAYGNYLYYDASWLFYDFGPRWYIEVGADGKAVGVPFNAADEPLFGLSGYYLVGTDPVKGSTIDSNYNAESEQFENEYFPVEISEDRNTITIKALEKSGYTYYPNCATWSGAEWQASAVVLSEITLKRGWDPATEPMINIQDIPTARMNFAGSGSVKPQNKPCTKSMTPLIGQEELPVLKSGITTAEMIREKIAADRQ